MHIDVGEAFLGKVCFEGGECFGSGHVGHQAHIDFCDGFAGEDGLATRASVSADETFNVDRGSRDEHLHRFFPTRVVNPAVDALLFLGFGFVEALRGHLDHLFFRKREGAGFRSKTFHDRVVPVRRKPAWQALRPSAMRDYPPWPYCWSADPSSARVPTTGRSK